MGQKAGKILAARFGSLDALAQATAEELTEIDDIGGITAQYLTEWFAAPQSQHLIAALVVAGEAAGSKLRCAQELGVPVLDEEQFLMLIWEREGDSGALLALLKK